MNYYKTEKKDKSDILTQLDNVQELNSLSEIVKKASEEIKNLRKRIISLENAGRHLYAVPDNEMTDLEKSLTDLNSKLNAKNNRRLDDIERIRQLGNALLQYIRCDWSCSSQTSVHYGCSCGANKAYNNWTYEFDD